MVTEPDWYNNPWDHFPPESNQDGWQPIDTAPRDGSRVLIGAKFRDGPGSWYCIASFLHGHWQNDWVASGPVNRKPTHWMSVKGLPDED